MSQADVGFGQQFFGRITRHLTELPVDSGEAEGGRIRLEHADAGKLEHGTESRLAVPQRFGDFPQKQERDLVLADDRIHFVVLQSFDDRLRRGHPLFKFLVVSALLFSCVTLRQSQRQQNLLASLRLPRTTTRGRGSHQDQRRRDQDVVPDRGFKVLYNVNRFNGEAALEVLLAEPAKIGPGPAWNSARCPP